MSISRILRLFAHIKRGSKQKAVTERDGICRLNHRIAVRLGQFADAFELDVGMVCGANSVVANFVHARVDDAAKLELQRFKLAGFQL